MPVKHRAALVRWAVFIAALLLAAVFAWGWIVEGGGSACDCEASLVTGVGDART